MNLPFLPVVVSTLAVLPLGAEEAKSSPAETRARHRKQSPAVLKIIEPVRVKEVYYYKDGGTIGILLTDAKGIDHPFCLDGRSESGRSTNHLFLGAVYPTRPGARKVPLQGPEESALYGVLLRWADQHPHRKALYDEAFDLNRKEFGNLWEIRAFFLRLDRRFTGK